MKSKTMPKTSSGKAALTLLQLEIEAWRLFDRMRLLQELANIALQRVPDTGDQEYAELQAVLTGLKEMLCNDGGAVHRLGESLSVHANLNGGGD